MPRILYNKASERRLDEIWHYTVSKWDLSQANKYINDLSLELKTLLDANYNHRKAPDSTSLPSNVLNQHLYIYRYKYHFIFYRILSSGDIAVLSILHQSMNMPERLKEDFKDV